MINNSPVEGSFRDPNGFVFIRDGKIYRQINRSYQDDFELLTSDGLHQSLVDSGLLIDFKEVDLELASSSDAYKIIEPEQLKFISYPYEWSFSQLKDAALTTLKIQKAALNAGMSLKDSSAYNIQFLHGKPVFIDTLSFEKYKEGLPWVAYRQFCQHFLAPLALMSYTDIRLNLLLKVFIDGIPLDMASSLLPGKSKLNFSLLSHIHFHAKGQKRYQDKQVQSKSMKMSKFLLLALIDSLESAIKKLKWKPKDTEWGDYYEATNYSSDSINEKKKIVSSFIEQVNPSTVWDLGANTGEFSRIASERSIETIAFDIDSAAVEKNYLQIKKSNETFILPLILDLTNPSGGIGWGNTERTSLLDRGPADLVMALALIHHLAISNNVPLAKVAGFLKNLAPHLIIEFVPKSDSQVIRLLSTREDVFPNYTIEGFENEFSQFFHIEKKVRVDNTERTMYLLRSKG
jgi:hypothetical protein